MKNFLSRNLGLKILSLLIALLLFSAAPGNKEVSLRKVFTVPLQVLGEDALEERELILYPPASETIQITLRGTNAALQNVNTQELNVSVNLSEVESAGPKKLPVAVTGLPPNVTREHDITVEMTVDNLLDKTVPIKVTFSEQLQTEYIDRYIIQSDDKAYLTGPKKIVETITQGSVLVTEDMLRDVDGYLMKALPILWMDDQGRPVAAETELKSSVQYIDVTMYPEKEVPVHVNLQGEAAEGYRIMDAVSVPETVRICADPQTLAQIDQIETMAVDVQGLTSNKSQLIGLRQYDGVFLGLGQPSQVEVLIEAAALSIRTFEISDIEPVNLADGYQASVVDESITVTLKGLASVLDGIKEEDLYAEVDMTDAVRGTRKYTVTVRDVPEGVDDVEVDPSRISVRVTS